MKIRRTRVVGVGVYVGVVALALAVPAPSFSQDSRPLKIAYSMLSKETATAWVAEERGFFKKNGLGTNIVLIQTGTTLIQALVGGDVDIGFTAPPAVVSAIAGGVDLKIILGQANNLNFIIAAQPEIKRIQDIAGKKVGVSRTGSSTWIGLMMALEHYRLDPSKEKITIVNAGTDPARFAALTTRALDASIINPGFAAQLTAQGFNVVARLNELGVPYTQGSLVTTRRFIQNQRDPYSAFGALLDRGDAVLYRPEEPRRCPEDPRGEVETERQQRSGRPLPRDHRHLRTETLSFERGTPERDSILGIGQSESGRSERGDHH